jgi:hypothetical protein
MLTDSIEWSNLLTVDGARLWRLPFAPGSMETPHDYKGVLDALDQLQSLAQVAAAEAAMDSVIRGGISNGN